MQLIYKKASSHAHEQPCACDAIHLQNLCLRLAPGGDTLQNGSKWNVLYHVWNGIKVNECGMIIYHYHLHIVLARLAFSTMQRKLCMSNSNFFLA